MMGDLLGTKQPLFASPEQGTEDYYALAEDQKLRKRKKTEAKRMCFSSSGSLRRAENHISAHCFKPCQVPIHLLILISISCFAFLR
jgi:hypothetical protein